MGVGWRVESYEADIRRPPGSSLLSQFDSLPGKK